MYNQVVTDSGALAIVFDVSQIFVRLRHLRNGASVRECMPLAEEMLRYATTIVGGSSVQLVLFAFDGKSADDKFEGALPGHSTESLLFSITRLPKVRHTMEALRLLVAKKKLSFAVATYIR
jgi:hypothetical protein